MTGRSVSAAMRPVQRRRRGHRASRRRRRTSPGTAPRRRPPAPAAPARSAPRRGASRPARRRSPRDVERDHQPVAERTPRATRTVRVLDGERAEHHARRSGVGAPRRPPAGRAGPPPTWTGTSTARQIAATVVAVRSGARAPRPGRRRAATALPAPANPRATPTGSAEYTRARRGSPFTRRTTLPPMRSMAGMVIIARSPRRPRTAPDRRRRIARGGTAPPSRSRRRRRQRTCGRARTRRGATAGAGIDASAAYECTK